MKPYLSLLLVSIIVIGCSILNNDADLSEIEFVFQKSEQQFELPDFDVVYSDNGNTVIHRDQFSENNTSLQAGPFNTKKAGAMSVKINLLKNKIPQSSGAVSLPLKQDWKHRIIFKIGAEDPTKGCFGCKGYESFAIDSTFKSSPNDSLYIIWGGNSISNPVEY